MKEAKEEERDYCKKEKAKEEERDYCKKEAKEEERCYDMIIREREFVLTW